MKLENIGKVEGLKKRLEAAENKLSEIKNCKIEPLYNQNDFKVSYRDKDGRRLSFDLSPLGIETMEWLVSREKLRLEQAIMFLKMEIEKL